MAVSKILGPDGQPIQLEVLSAEISAPSTTGIRRELTPQIVARILASTVDFLRIRATRETYRTILLGAGWRTNQGIW